MGIKNRKTLVKKKKIKYKTNSFKGTIHSEDLKFDQMSMPSI